MPGTNNKWTSPTGPTPPLLWMVIVGLLFGGIVGAVAAAEEDDVTDVAAGGPTTTTVDGVDPSGDGDTAGGIGSDPLSDPAAHDQLPSTSGSQAEVVQGGSADADPAGQLAMPKPASYQYTATSSGEGGGSQDYTLTVKDVAENRQEHTREGTGFGDATFVHTYDEKSMLLTEIRSRGEACTFDQPIEWYPRTLAVGTTWKDSATCQNAQGTVTIEIDAAIKEKAFIDLGGTKVPVWVIELVQVTRAESPTFGSFVDRVDGRTWLDPARGLELRQEQQHEITAKGTGGEEERTSFTVTNVLKG